MATVKLEKIVKHYPNNQEPTVRGIDLDIADREFVVLVGPSGCGKSTCLRMIAGLEEISSGDLSIGERRVNDLPPKERNIAMVFQNYALFPNLTVAQNIAFGLKVRRVPAEDRAKAVSSASEILGLEGLLDRKPGELSGGQRQRVAVGRAIVRKPEVFLFDEPLSNLDASLRGQMRAEIIKLHRRLETTMVYVTHDQIEAMTMADRIVVFEGGHIRQMGTPQEVYESPSSRFVAGFIGNPPMNFLDGHLKPSGHGGLFSCKGIELEIERASADLSGEITLGIRPEDVHVATSKPQNVRTSKPVAARVDLVEYFGSESAITTRIDAQSLVLTHKGRVDPSKEQLEVVLNLDRVHLFPRESSV